MNLKLAVDKNDHTVRGAHPTTSKKCYACENFRVPGSIAYAIYKKDRDIYLCKQCYEKGHRSPNADKE